MKSSAETHAAPSGSVALAGLESWLRRPLRLALLLAVATLVATAATSFGEVELLRAWGGGPTEHDLVLRQGVIWSAWAILILPLSSLAGAIMRRVPGWPMGLACHLPIAALVASLFLVLENSLTAWVQGPDRTEHFRERVLDQADPRSTRRRPPWERGWRSGAPEDSLGASESPGPSGSVPADGSHDSEAGSNARDGGEEPPAAGPSPEGSHSEETAPLNGMASTGGSSAGRSSAGRSSAGRGSAGRSSADRGSAGRDSAGSRTAPGETASGDAVAGEQGAALTAAQARERAAARRGRGDRRRGGGLTAATGFVTGDVLLDFERRWTLRVPRYALIYFALIGLGLGARAFLVGRTKDREAAALELRASQLQAALTSAQLSALKGQLHPHFLFNALHSVGGMIRAEQPAEALSALARVGDLLRTSLDAGPEQFVTLAREIELAERYLEVEQLRLGDRLRLELYIPAELAAAEVPAFITQPLVENAIKHGVAVSKHGGTVRLRATANDDGTQLLIDIEDDGPGFQPGSPDGVGLEHVRTRLATLFEDEASFKIGAMEAGGTRAQVRIPLDDLEPEHPAEGGAAPSVEEPPGGSSGGPIGETLG